MCDSNGYVLEEHDYIVKPCHYTIPKDSTRLHGITNDRALTEGVDLEVVLERFSDALEKADCLVAHNIAFDAKVLGCEYIRTSNKDPLQQKQKICTMKNDKVINYCKLPGPYCSYKLTKLVELHEKLFGCGFENMHNAKYDVEALVKCFWELKKINILVVLLNKK
jgi:DNA polymerase III alpha subunit (gram-positive type)